MPKADRGRGGKRFKPSFGERSRETLQQIDENSPVLQSFRQYAIELDTKHDKYERLVKLSRDVTIESKRIIFLLHTVDTSEKKAETIISEAKGRLSKLVTSQFKLIAEELKGEDPSQFLRAFTSGVQEFIEATTFCHYLEAQTLRNWVSIQDEMKYDTVDSTDEESLVPVNRHLKMPLNPMDYMLGVGDLTGELMRKCINSLSAGKIENCFQTCKFVRSIFNGFLSIGYTGNREFGRKIQILRQSLGKMENVCYSIHVRGSEVPKHVLADVLSKSEENLEEDEGFY